MDRRDKLDNKMYLDINLVRSNIIGICLILGAVVFVQISENRAGIESRSEIVDV